MSKWTIRPMVTGYANSDKKTYLYHHSTHSYFNVEGKILLPTMAFLAEGGKGILSSWIREWPGRKGPARITTPDPISPKALRFTNALPPWASNVRRLGWSSSPIFTGITSFTWKNS